MRLVIVARALSLVPDQRADFVAAVSAQYLPMGLVSTGADSRVLARAQTELLATRVLPRVREAIAAG